MDRFRVVPLIIVGAVLTLSTCSFYSAGMIWPSDARAQCALVSSKVATANGNSTNAVTFSGTSGNTITVSVITQNVAGTPTVIDTQNTYTPDNVSTVDSSNTYIFRFHRFNIPAGVNSVTVILNAGQSNSVFSIVQFSGGSNVLDKKVGGGNNGNPATWSPNLSGALSQAKEIVFADAGNENNFNGTLAQGPRGGYTPVASVIGGEGTLMSAVLLTANNSTTNTNWIVTAGGSGNTDFSAILTTFECNAAAAGGPQQAGFFVPIKWSSLGLGGGLIPIVNHYE